MTTPTPRTWWYKLDPDTRTVLIEAPDGPVAPECVDHVARAGGLATGTWWPDTRSGPDGFYLPADFIEQVEHGAEVAAWTRAEKAYADDVAIFFPSDGSSGPVFTTERRKALVALREAADAARVAVWRHYDE